MAGSRIDEFKGRLFAVEQADPEALVAPTDTDVVALSSMSMAPTRSDFTLRNRQGNRSPQGNVPVSESASWNFNQDFQGSGVVGTAPDTEAFLKSVFGQAATVGAGTVAITALADASGLIRASAAAHGLVAGDWITIHGTGTAADGIWRVAVPDAGNVDLLESDSTGIVTATGTIEKATRVYKLSDDCIFLSLWDYNSPGTVRQRAITGGSAGDMTFTFNPQEVLAMAINGSGRWMIDSEQFASLSTKKKAGLGAYPAQPASPVYTGSAVSARNFRIGINDLGIGGALDASFTLNTGIAASVRGANQGLSNGIDTEQRSVSVSCNAFDADSVAAIANAYAKADSGLRVGVTFAAFESAGLAAAVYAPSVLLAKPTTDSNSGARSLSLSGVGGESGSGLLDEAVLVLG